MNVLFIGAHPDDIEYFMGGLAARYAKRGDNVFFCVATDGQIGSYGMTREEIAELRHGEAQKSCDIIGAKLMWLGIEDEMLFDDRETRMTFIEAVRQAKPDVIFAQTKFRDYNQDHDISGYLAFEARILATVKLMATKHDVIDHIPPLFTCAPMGHMPTAHNPQYFIDVTDVYETKRQMLAAHASQDGEWSKDAFGVYLSDLMENADKFYASACGTPGVQYVESYALCTDWPIIADAYKMLP